MIQNIYDRLYTLRFYLGLISILGLLVAIGVYGINKAGMINQRVNNIFTQELVPLESIEDIKASIYRIRERVGRHITEPDRQAIHEAKIYEQINRLARNESKYKQSRLDNKELGLLKSLDMFWAKYISIVQETVIPLSRAGQVEKAEDVLYGVALQAFRGARLTLNTLSDYQIHRAEDRQKQAHQAYVSILQLTLAIIIFSLLLGIFIAIRYKQHNYDKKLGDLILNHSSQGVMITDKQLKITWVNPAFEKITGYSDDDVMGKTPAVLSSGNQPASFYKNMWASITEAGRWEGEISNKHKSGRIYPEWLNIVALKNKRGDVERYAGTFIDLTPLKVAEEKINQLAYYDSLTQLGNRYFLDERLPSMLTTADESDHQIGVLLIDLDHFKEINSSLGRHVGDELLKSMAELLLKNMPKDALATRYDGDRFILVIPFGYSSYKRIELELAELAQKIQKCLSTSLQGAYHEVRISCSVGISCFPKDATDGATLLKSVSIALEHSKKIKSNDIRFYDTKMSEEINHLYQLRLGISKAIERDEFYLVYQPQVDNKGHVIGAEVLLRWESKEFGFISPDVFIPIAEESGDIIAIGRWVFTQALLKVKLWKKQGLFESGIFRRLAINVSIHQIVSDKAYKEFDKLCRSEEVAPELIEIEITETGMMSFTEHVINRLKQLRDDGFSLAVDDFGTGQSSLARLNDFPVNILKIDRSFIQQILSDKTQASIVHYIINLAHTLNMEVVVEGVEDVASVEMLMGFGCDVFQGYYFSKPILDTDFIDYIDNQTSQKLFEKVSSVRNVS